jgi:urea transport system ATP-binding protein
MHFRRTIHHLWTIKLSRTSVRNRLGGDLSCGQQPQLAIGRILVVEPRMLILDEPSEGIQPKIVAQIGEVIRKLVEEDGLTVLLVQ